MKRFESDVFMEDPGYLCHEKFEGIEILFLMMATLQILFYQIKHERFYK